MKRDFHKPKIRFFLPPKIIFQAKNVHSCAQTFHNIFEILNTQHSSRELASRSQIPAVITFLNSVYIIHFEVIQLQRQNNRSISSETVNNVRLDGEDARKSW